MEVTLGQLKDRWKNIKWGMDPYKGGEVPLLKMAEEDFEALEVPKNAFPVLKHDRFPTGFFSVECFKGKHRAKPICKLACFEKLRK